MTCWATGAKVAPMEPTLFTEPTSYDSRVLRWLAVEKQCPIEHRVVQSFEVTIDQLPNMQDRGLNLVEHETLVQYLQERYPGEEFLPRDPKIRAQIRQICAIVRLGIGMGDFIDQMSALMVKDQGYLFGTEFTLADIYVGVRLHELQEERVGMPKLVGDYYHRLAGRRAFKEALG